MQDLSNGLHNCTVLVKGYHQIPVATEDIPKTAIITPFGLFEYLFNPFWAVQRRSNISENDGPYHRWFGCVFAYIDDSHVGSPDRQTHLHHLEAFFKALAASGLAINLEKCVFATPSLEILGHTISATGAAPMADHRNKKLPTPSGYQTIATFSRHGKLLPPFSAQVCTNFETFN
jgi:hypothetical protein